MTDLSVWGERSKRNLKGVHPDLVAVITRAKELSEVDFIITEGLRTEARQRQLFNRGASKTMNSRHLTGHAVDVAARIDGRVSWDWPLYHLIHGAVSEAADELEIIVDWGGNWLSFPDGPHYQLPRGNYPAVDHLPPDYEREIEDRQEPKAPKPPCARSSWEVGDKGTCVNIIQTALNNFARAAKVQRILVDGAFGPQTKSRVQRFQLARDLDNDGIVGPKTWLALEPYL